MTYTNEESTRRTRQACDLDFTLEEHFISFDHAHHVGCSTAEDISPKDVAVSQSSAAVNRNRTVCGRREVISYSRNYHESVCICY